MSVAETAAGEKTLDRMIEVGKELRDEDGADVIVMGCAGMARHRQPLEAALGMPVIDPTQAAVAMAIGAVQFAARLRTVGSWRGINGSQASLKPLAGVRQSRRSPWL